MDAIVIAADYVNVMNFSFGGPGNCGVSPDTAYQQAINYARDRGVVIVVAAGNGNADVSNVSPASCNGVIAVGSVDRSGKRSSFSNYGSKIDVAAPGGGIITFLNSSWNYPIYSLSEGGSTVPIMQATFVGKSGTSMAAPQVSGIAALLLERFPWLSPDQVECTIKMTTTPWGASGLPMPDKPIGVGLVDAHRAVISSPCQ